MDYVLINTVRAYHASWPLLWDRDWYDMNALNGHYIVRHDHLNSSYNKFVKARKTVDSHHCDIQSTNSKPPPMRLCANEDTFAHRQLHHYRKSRCCVR